MPKPYIHLKKIYHREFWALRDISFDVSRGETLGILGRNGSGKSTLLQIICSVMQATLGDVQVNGRISALLELGAGFNPEFTGLENVLLNGSIMGISRKEMLRRLPEIEKFADIGDYFNQPVKRYSSGMHVRVAFAVAINVDPDILIIDEALSVGDIKFQEKCYRKFTEFQKAGRTIVFVTHATSLVEELCNRAIVIESGNIAYIGDPQSAVSEYEAILFPRKNVVVKNKEHTSTEEVSKLGQKITVPASEVVIDDVVKEDRVVGQLFKKFLVEKPVVDQCHFRRSYNANELRFGDGGGTIMDYLIVSCGAEDPVAIQSGAEVSIYIKVLGELGINSPSLGVGIFTHTGLMICSGNARLSNKKLHKIENGKYYIYRMSFLALIVEGHYFIHFGLTEDVFGKIVRHDARRSIAAIRVKATPHLEGIADLSMQLEEVRLSI